MSYALIRYRILEAELAVCRSKYGTGSDKEDSLLDEMDDLWWELDDDERDMLRKEGVERWQEKP